VSVIAGRCDRVAALCVLVLVACSRGAAPPEPAPTPDPVVAPRDAPPPAPPRDAPPPAPPRDAHPPAPSVAAPQPECWTFADASGRAHEVCITIADPGRPLDEMTTSESGRIVVTRDGTLVADRAYASVFEDGAAGSIYSTYRTEAGEPALVVRRTGDCQDKCVREARVPTDRGDIVVMRECDVSCGD
jgi:hypothetical protein